MYSQFSVSHIHLSAQYDILQNHDSFEAGQFGTNNSEWAIRSEQFGANNSKETIKITKHLHDTKEYLTDL